MTDRERLGRLGLLGVVVVLLMLIGSSLSGLELQPGRPLPLGNGEVQVGEGAARPAAVSGILELVVPVVMLFLLVTFTIFMVLYPDVRAEVFKRVLTGIGVSLFVYLLLRLFMLQAAEEDFDRASYLTETPTPIPVAAAPSIPETAPEPSRWLVILLGSAVLCLALAALWYWWLRSRRREQPQTLLAQLADEASSALVALRRGDDLHQTVIRCYTEMNRILSRERGVERQHNMTARDFEQRLLGAGIQDTHVHQLTRLFEAARYGHRLPDQQQEQAAVASLEAIVRRYGGQA